MKNFGLVLLYLAPILPVLSISAACLTAPSDIANALGLIGYVLLGAWLLYGGRHLMKRFGLVALMLCLAVGCTRVEPGYVGIKVNMNGSQKGVQDYPLQTGRVWLNPFTEEVYEYPTFMQTISWTGEEAITFNSKEGASITAPVSLSYSLDAQRVPHLFVEFRQDIEAISHGYLRNKVRDALNRAGGGFKAIEIFGEEKQKLLDQIHEDLAKSLTEKGFVLDSVSFIAAPTADARVMQSINAVIESTQRAIEAENKVRQVEAEAKQGVAEAQGKAESALIVAKSQVEANAMLTQSITDQLVKYQLVQRLGEAIEKWNGDIRLIGVDK